MVKSRYLAAFCILGMMLAGFCSHARADVVESPLYKSWAKFAVGSNKTLTGSFTAGPVVIQSEVTTTLKEVTDDHVTIETAYTQTVNGQTRAFAPRTQTFPAKDDDKKIKNIGEEDVQAMGKTFHCKVWKIEGKDDAVSNGHGEAKIWTTDQVPGGAIKMTMHALDHEGQPADVTYIISRYEAK